MYGDEISEVAGRIAGAVIGLLRQHSPQERYDNRVAHWQQREQRREGGLAHRLGLNPANIHLGGPPAMAQGPGGGMAPVKGGQVAQGKVFPLGATSLGGNGVLTGDLITGALQVRAERSFWPRRLILIPNVEGLVEITDVSIATNRQFSNLQAAPIEIFGDKTTFSEVDFDVITAGVTALIGLQFVATDDDQAIRVKGAYYGQEL